MYEEPIFSRVKGFAAFCLWAFFVGGALRFLVAMDGWRGDGRRS